jgi:hypothetical protein
MVDAERQRIKDACGILIQSALTVPSSGHSFQHEKQISPEERFSADGETARGTENRVPSRSCSTSAKLDDPDFPVLQVRES